MTVTDGAQLISNTEGQGNAGNIIINARESTSFIGSSALGQGSASASSVEPRATGNGGNVEIATGSLIMTGGAQLVASTEGQGDAGSVLITASDFVSLSGLDQNGRSTAILTNATADSSGRSGVVIITTPSLRVSDSAVVNTRTNNLQQSGDILINVGDFEVTDGGQLISTTLSGGSSGNINIDADRILISGQDTTFEQRLNQFGRFVIPNEGSGESGLFVNTLPNSTGSGGNIALNTNALSLLDGAQIAAFTAGTGNPGNIVVTEADSITLDNSTISTTVNSGAILSNPTDRQGDIDLQTRQLTLSSTLSN